MPFSKTMFFDRDPGWGLYTNDGKLITEGCYERSEDRQLIGQSRARDLSGVEISDAPIETMIYGGPIIMQFGHFIISSLARLWAVDESCPVLFHSHFSLKEEDRGYFTEILHAAGRDHTNSYVLDYPTRIPRLIVPEPSFFEMLYVSREYAITAREIGEKFSKTDRFKDARCYLSKGKLSFGVARLIDEEVVEQAFAGAGFEVVHPETLSLSDQISLFRNAEVICGTVSSAFHVLAFAPASRAKRFIFDYIGRPFSNFPLIDLISGGHSEYISLAGRVHMVEQASFMLGYKADDISALAEQMTVLTLSRLGRS